VRAGATVAEVCLARREAIDLVVAELMARRIEIDQTIEGLRRAFPQPCPPPPPGVLVREPLGQLRRGKYGVKRVKRK
jgi:hypothetical protein